MPRAPGLSVRLKFTLSYAAVIMIAGLFLLAVVWVFLLRYVPDGVYLPPGMPFIPNRSDLLRAFLPRAAQGMAVLLVFGLAGGWILAGRMLSPLTRITNAARRASAGSLAHRIEMEGRKDEFRELADVFDAMLARLEAHVAEQQRFAANASHELRTPLAITQTLLDVARNDPTRNPAELVERLRAVNTRAIELTEALLLLSRADQRSFARETVDLSLLVEEAAETLLAVAEKRGVTIQIAGETALAVGSAALLLQTITNLIHNAIVHNLPERGTVAIRTIAGADAVTLTIENTGEKLTPELVSTLTEPFRRGNVRVRSDHGGVGLGLAIVKSIVKAHDGTLTVVALPAGGMKVEAQLPAAPDPGGGRLTSREVRGSRAGQGAADATGRSRVNDLPEQNTSRVVLPPVNFKEVDMLRAGILWLLGVPVFIIVLLAVFTNII